MGRVDAAFTLLDIAERASGARGHTLIRSVEQLSQILLTEAKYEHHTGREWDEVRDVVERLHARVAALLPG